MLPGPDQIVACPYCKRQANYETWLSGTVFGVLCWTDGKSEYTGLIGPSPPAVAKCHHCAEFYWLADAKKIGTRPWRMKDQDPLLEAIHRVREPTEGEYYQALERNLAKNRQQDRTLRILAWRRRNDAFRFHPQNHTPVSEAGQRNLEALARLLDEGDEDDCLMKAEVFRELGQFHLAKGLLGQVRSSKHRTVVRQLRDLCHRGDSCVRQLTFAEAQDVTALIEMVKTNRDRLAAILALRDMGAYARAAIPVLVESLRDNDEEIAFRAADALREIGGWEDSTSRF